ncbi:MAG: DapH/DapD/GlmU-related protein [Bacteroidota bacterium]
MSLIKRYHPLKLLWMIYCVIRTKLLFKKARLIRFPFDVRGRKFISVLNDFTTGIGCRLEAYPEDGKSTTITIGNNVQINDYVHITGIKSVIIGNNVLIASKVYISDSSHGSYSGDENDSNPGSIPKDRPLFSKNVKIEDNVWLGEMVSVLAGVTIGKGTIVGANSVVTKNLPANVIAVGSPAKPIKKYNFDSLLWEKY